MDHRMDPLSLRNGAKIIDVLRKRSKIEEHPQVPTPRTSARGASFYGVTEHTEYGLRNSLPSWQLCNQPRPLSLPTTNDRDRPPIIYDLRPEGKQITRKSNFVYSSCVLSCGRIHITYIRVPRGRQGSVQYEIELRHLGSIDAEYIHTYIYMHI